MPRPATLGRILAPRHWPQLQTVLLVVLLIGTSSLLFQRSELQLSPPREENTLQLLRSPRRPAHAREQDDHQAEHITPRTTGSLRPNSGRHQEGFQNDRATEDANDVRVLVDSSLGTPARDPPSDSQTASAASGDEQVSATISPVPTPQPTPSTRMYTSTCDLERDFRLLNAVAASRQQFWGSTTSSSDSTPAQTSSDSTEVSLYRVNGGIRATVFSNLRLNLKNAMVHRPIFDLASDGGDHDPHYEFQTNMVQCHCSQLTVFARTSGGDSLNIWDGTLVATEQDFRPTSTICDPATGSSLLSENDSLSIHFDEPVILMARRDDHNPFFQVSSVLNAWIVAKALN